MAEVKYKGSGSVAATDYKYVKWVGVTKSGGAITIELPRAICLSNIDWTFADKNDVVPEIEFQGVYSDTTIGGGDRSEPWIVTVASTVTAGAGEILLGAGKLFIGTASTSATAIGLTRGGGSFTVEREYREINADGDPGAVEGRIVQEEGRPKLRMNVLEFITKVSNIYAGLTTTT